VSAVDTGAVTAHGVQAGARSVDTAVPLREPASVMRLERLGAFHQTRLSFMRVLTRRMRRERWRFTRPVFELDAAGVGHAVYSVITPERTYSLVAFAHDLPAELRSDRVIAEAWDSTFTLFDGVPTAQDIERLARNVPVQEAGRLDATELSLGRANRSVRLWAHVVESLAAGRQPDTDRIEAVGYLMRTTAVYGSGKFGAADRESIADRAELSGPFQIEMLTVYLVRAWVRDLVQHAADAAGGAASVPLDPDIARSIGIGNSTGLGMAPFILNHPVLFDHWIGARETALSRVRGVARVGDAERATFHALLTRSVVSAARWRTEHPLQGPRVARLREDLDSILVRIDGAEHDCLGGDRPWDRLYRWAEANLDMEGQECLVSLMLEPYGELVDDLVDTLACDQDLPAIDGAMPLSAVADIIDEVYGWARSIDWEGRPARARAWYVSAEKLEPRLGERFEEPIEPYEQPLAPGRDAIALQRALASWSPGAPVAELLLRHPEHRHTVRRLQTVACASYAEIRDNTIGATVSPADMLRAKLSFFGAIHFDPRSDRWVRICMYANAPYPEELASGDADTWPYPDLPAPDAGSPA